MYSSELAELSRRLAHTAELDPRDVTLADQAFSALVAQVASKLRGVSNRAARLSDLTVRLLLISEALLDVPSSRERDATHYLVAMGLEQSTPFVRRPAGGPLSSDVFYRLTLAFLHYLAGGYRVQSLTTLDRLRRLGRAAQEGRHAAEYADALNALTLLQRGGTPEASTKWTKLLFAKLQDGAGPSLSRLARQARARKEALLRDIGLGAAAAWLERRGVDESAAKFWEAYVDGLQHRGITSFTDQQVGEGFDSWLRLDRDLVVLLPTGSGKTVIGELRCALALAAGKQVVWVQPTRALVRQTKAHLSAAFEPVGVETEELPTTEDYIPQFAEGLGAATRACSTTPERLFALVRSNPDALSSVGLLVIDEAHLLFDEARGVTAESLLRAFAESVPDGRVVLLTPFQELKAGLTALLAGVGRDAPAVLEAELRPTRRVYGILTARNIQGKYHPVLALYPPGPQAEDGTTSSPALVVLNSETVSKDPGPTEIGGAFCRAATQGGFSTALFVQQKGWTESQAEAISRDPNHALPVAAIARLRLELGRESILERTASARVAPHHAGLSGLEQHLVERWVRQRVVRTVVATETLAQGMNLPFEWSVLTFTTRYNPINPKRPKPLPNADLLNILGRAGRAGMVSDGIGLVVEKPSGKIGAQLDKARRYFFQKVASDDRQLGMAGLVARALEHDVSRREWVRELDGMLFSETQTLCALALRLAGAGDTSVERFIEALRRFPSIATAEEAWLRDAANQLSAVADHLLEDLRDAGPDVTRAAARTGMPIELLAAMAARMPAPNDAALWGDADWHSWSDETVVAALAECAGRRWVTKLMDGNDPAQLIDAVAGWRAGQPFAALEATLKLKKRTKDNRIAVGEFLRKDLALLSQLWGGLATLVDESELSSSEMVDTSTVMQLPSMVREGVNSLDSYLWLQVIGGHDRVLAHALAGVVVIGAVGARDRRKAMRGLVRRWKQRGAVPAELTDAQRDALLGVLEEQ